MIELPNKKNRTLKLVAAFFGITILILWIFSIQTKTLQTGNKPGFPKNLTAIDGRSLNFIHNPSNPLVVNFFATWCPPCLLETPFFVKLAKKYDGQISFIGLAVDSPIPHIEAFKNKFLIPYAIAIAPFQMVADWKAEQLPMTYLLNPKGEIIWSHRGFTSESELESAITSALSVQ